MSRIDSSLGTVRRTLRAVGAEIDALYMLETAARHALETGDLDPLRRALADLDVASAARRGT